ncbi:hypothetical protein AA13595_3064 [Gluconacetobacter johannae DSM 13595]|uniref:Uracil-DNA glycosylase-like domain-containing protein n=1 Tax=Gluconacetobacter johannae TaxID=112140 RepID=A0A7W4P3X4_9PROT|nr:hypothetical protein [Gluconacetobacter johannae]MBB2176651.1 hypothetical protein [Gluconacetobacter johannae]GBQ91217.1 hypothetical protein AA13595_3064 [Gluconacetobacter johannae DSM 13595]
MTVSTLAERQPAFLPNHHFGGPGNIGNPAHRTLWLCGIEYGESPDQRGSENEIADYSVAMQWRNWTYNRNAFKLIAAIEGQDVATAQAYAGEKKIFESNTSDYFQTNLFPEECRNLETWSQDAQLRTGFKDKQDYLARIRSTCFRQMHEQVLHHQPRLFIGVGLTHAEDFCQVVLGRDVTLERHAFSVNGHPKTILLHPGPIPFAVVPHLSARSGLNSNEALATAGRLIRDMIQKS